MGSEWTEEGNEEKKKKPNKTQQERKKEERKKRREIAESRKKMRWEKHFAGSLSVNHNLLGVGCEGKSAILQWLSLSSQL